MKKILGYIIILLAFNLDLQAQTLQEYQITAGKNNPLLKARYAEYQAALEQVPQAGALPDPEATFGFFLRPMERLMGNQVGEASLMQMFPWFGTLDAAEEEANYMAKMQFAAFMEEKINLYHNVRAIWLNLYQVEEEVQLLERELEVLQALERVALAKYTAAPAGNVPERRSAGASGSMSSNSTGNTASGMAGMGGSTGSTSPTRAEGSAGMRGGSMASMASSGTSMVDVILTRVQVKDLENRLTLLRESKKPLQVKFNNLLNRQSGEEIFIADTLQPVALPATLALIQDSILQNHPMLQMYAWDEKAREAQYRMAQLMGRPMFGLGLNYMVLKPREDAMREMAIEGRNMVMPMVSVSLPIYRKKYKAAKKEAKFEQEAAMLKKEAAENELLTELENLLYDYERATSTLALLEEQIALNEQAIRLLTTNYSVAGTGIEEILRQRQAILNYKQQQLQAITNQHLAVSAINRMMNSDS